MSRVRAAGLDFHVQRLAPEPPVEAQPPVVVCIHGLLLDSLASYYFTVGPAFAAAGFEVVMYDQRGHGRTTRPESGYRLDDFVADLAELIEALEIDRPVHVMGNSFGSSVAFGLAATRPELVASVINLEGEPPTLRWRTRMSEAVAEARERLPFPETIEMIRQQLGPQTARLSKNANKIIQSTPIVEDFPLSSIINDDLSAISCPVFSIFGDDSGLADQVPQFEAQLDYSRSVIWPNQSHSVLVERTPEIIELAGEWVREVSRLPARAH